ncbi:serine protease snake-like [Diaphorina citri]|uniref:Serine protease snake-like n=1 Tax=Diaphorina citri TaxID=121845 RepID=A0A3Q0IMY3_DIACI|nr:serine protease snake-like [Diaphorina citri]
MVSRIISLICLRSNFYPSLYPCSGCQEYCQPIPPPTTTTTTTTTTTPNEDDGLVHLFVEGGENMCHDYCRVRNRPPPKSPGFTIVWFGTERATTTLAPESDETPELGPYGMCHDYCRVRNRAPPKSPEFTIVWFGTERATTTLAPESDETPELGPYGVQGGVDSKLNEFAHMVAIGFGTPGSGSLSWNSCGGTLISHWYVLTAAHCTDSDLGPPSVVRLGALNVNKHTPGQEVEDVNVASVTVHPDYQGERGDKSLYHDIALLRLERSVVFREGVQPACLYDSEEVVPQAVATGWGNLGFSDAPSDILQKVSLEIIPHQQCRDLLGSDQSVPDGIQATQVCAGILAGGHDTCSGDSGGPLQVNNTRTFRTGYTCGMEIIGVTSFGKFCAQKNTPGVYTRVAPYVPWIEDIVWSGSD